MRLISGHRDFGYGVHDYDIPRHLVLRPFQWTNHPIIGIVIDLIFMHVRLKNIPSYLTLEKAVRQPFRREKRV
jgi:hypothetical protein